MIDLAKGYQKRFGDNADAKFVLKLAMRLLTTIRNI